MYINKPSVTKIEAADRVHLLHSTKVRSFYFGQSGTSTEFRPLSF